MNSHTGNKRGLPNFWRWLRRYAVLTSEAVPPSTELELKGHEGLRGQDLITLSTQDWDFLWTRKQRFALQFARQGNRVLYVETQFHWLSYIKHFRRHWRRVYLFLFGPRRVEENLYVYTPPLLIPAFQIFPALAAINNFVLGSLLRKVMKNLGMHQPVLWMYTHYNKPLIKMLGAKKALYECVDDYAGAKGLLKASVVRQQEQATLKSVDAAIVTADGLRRSRVIHNPNLHVVRNAANVSHFNRAVTGSLPAPEEFRSIARPRLVFLGAVAYWIDLDLLEYVAKTRRDWNIVLIGPVLVDLSRLGTYKNVHILGTRPYKVLPAYLAHCDVALNPYKIDDVAMGCSPLKLYEYLAAGMPVVSTNMPEAARFETLVTVAFSYESFVSAVDQILARPEQDRQRLRKLAMDESQNHSWENRFLQVERIAAEVLQ